MKQKKVQWDKLLNIKTTGRDDSRSDQLRYSYEPTLYRVLERMAGSGLPGKKKRLFFYYPSDEYVSCFMTQGQLMFSDEFDCRDLFEGNDSRERILVFEMGSFDM